MILYVPKMRQMVDDKEKTRREIEVLKQEVAKDLEAFREEFQGMTESLAAAKEATQESNANLGIDRACTKCRRECDRATPK